MAKDNGYEMTSLNPGWIKRHVADNFSDEDFKKLINFYVINTPCVELSYCGIGLSEYGWSKNVWQEGNLKSCLLSIAGMDDGPAFFVATKLDQMKDICEQAAMKKDFHRNRDHERIVIYQYRKFNQFMSVFYHIRNAFAHGRFAIYDCENGEDEVVVLEDGKKSKDQFEVRARMILKKSTLMKWMQVIQSGKYPDEAEQKRKRSKKKSKTQQEVK